MVLMILTMTGVTVADEGDVLCLVCVKLAGEAIDGGGDTEKCDLFIRWGI